MFGLKNLFTKSGAKILTSADLDNLLRSESSSGSASVNETTSLGVAAFYACVKVLAESIGQLPLNLCKRVDGNRTETAHGEDLHNILHYEPNFTHNSLEFRELMMALALTKGDAVAYVTRDSRGNAYELFPVMNPEITVEDGWNVKYRVLLNGTLTEVPRENIFHLRGLSINGYTGMSPIAYQRETLASSINLQKHGSLVFKNGARPSGILSHPQKLSDPAAKRIKASWDGAHGGDKQGGTAVIEEGMTYTPVSLSNQDSQYIEAKQLSRTDICGIMRVPPHMIADLSKSSFSNITQQSLEYIKYSLLPWIKRWEQAIRRDILTKQQKKDGYFVDFDLNALERADITTRFASYVQGIQNGMYSPNDALGKEGDNPREGGDIYLTPVNMTTKPESIGAENEENTNS